MEANKKTYALAGFLLGILLVGLISFVTADFVRNGDGSTTIAFKVSAADSARMATALQAQPNQYVPKNAINDANLIGQTCLNFLNQNTKNYEISQAVKTAEATEKAKPGITFDTNVNAVEAQIG